MLVTHNLMILIAASYSTLVVCNDGLVAFPKPRFTSAMPAYDGSGDHSAITAKPMRTVKCTAARSSFAQAPSAENRNGTGPASKRKGRRRGARRLFSWFAWILRDWGRSGLQIDATPLWAGKSDGA